MTLQLGDIGKDVTAVQKLLSKLGYPLERDGIFGLATQAAVETFQGRTGLVVDGIVGPKTLAAAQGQSVGRLLKEGDLIRAAKSLGVDLASIKAVNEVESVGAGFLPSGRPKILFERHVMHAQLSLAGLDADTLAIQSPNLVNTKPGGYSGGESEHKRLAKAKSINAGAAICSASWGLFQIMGFHWQKLGFASPEAYSAAMSNSEGQQLDAFVRFILSDDKLHQALIDRKWAQFAKIYNGPNYKKNLYDIKLARAYQRYNAGSAQEVA